MDPVSCIAMEPMDLQWAWQFQMKRHDSVLVLRFPPEVGAQLSDPILRANFLLDAQQAILQIIKEEQTPRLVMDFKPLAYIGSAVLSMLIQCYRAARAKEGTLVLANLKEDVSKVFVLTHLDRMLKTFSSVEAAVTALLPEA